MEKEPNSIKIFTKVKLELSIFHPEILAFYEEMIISSIQLQILHLSESLNFHLCTFFLQQTILYIRDGFKTQPPVDQQFRPVPPGFYCSKQ